jgi:hypothetical protein
VLISSPTARDYEFPRCIESLRNKARERFEKNLMPLVTLEGPYGQEHTVLLIYAEFSAHARRIAISGRDPIRHDSE